MFDRVLDKLSIGIGKPRHRPVFACACHATSDGRNAYPEGHRHAMLVMLRAHERDVEQSLNKLLDENGWVDGVLQQAKKLDDPFLSDDPDLLEAYEAAKGTGCIIVYRDPIR